MSKDVLARGGRSATFLPTPKITQEKWDEMFANIPDIENKKVYPKKAVVTVIEENV